MADLLERVQRELNERLAELKPLVEEARQLEAALAALEGGEEGTSAPARPARARRTRSEQAQPAATGAEDAADSSGGAAKRGTASKPGRKSTSTSKRGAPKQGETRTQKPDRRKTTTPPESDERRKRVLAIVTENPGTTAGNLALLLDTSVAAMGALLKRLEREGKVEKAEKGYRAAKQTPA
jgi:Winged helix-turn-helix DNA-binding